MQLRKDGAHKDRSRVRVYLTPADTVLIGKYPQTAEHVHVECTSTSAFTVQLPDFKVCENRELIFYNVGAFSVTLRAITGQLFSDGGSTHVLNSGDVVSVVSDMKTMWLLSDINNSISPVFQYVYFGSYTVDGSWRMYISGTDFLVERLEAGTWVEKSRFLATSD